MSDKWGKKLTMFASNLAAFACWIATAQAKTKWLLFTSYSLQGVFGAVAYNCIGKVIPKTSLLLVCWCIQKYTNYCLHFRNLHRRDSSCFLKAYSGSISDNCCLCWIFVWLHVGGLCIVEVVQTDSWHCGHSTRCFSNPALQGDASLVGEKGQVG